MFEVSVWQITLIAVAVTAGALVQGSVGFGFALIAAPVFSLVAPELVPAAPLLLSIPLNSMVAARERHALDVAGFARIGIGLVVGTIAGFAILETMPQDSLTVAFGAAIVLAVVVTAAFPASEPGPVAHVVAGVASGTINTVAATGGPPLALVHHRLPGARLRASLALAFLVSNLLSLLGIIPAGRLGWRPAAFALVLLPAVAAGFAASHRASHALEGRWLRPAVLVFAGVSGVAAMIRGLLA